MPSARRGSTGRTASQRRGAVARASSWKRGQPPLGPACLPSPASRSSTWPQGLLAPSSGRRVPGSLADLSAPPRYDHQICSPEAVGFPTLYRCWRASPTPDRRSGASSRAFMRDDVRRYGLAQPWQRDDLGVIQRLATAAPDADEISICSRRQLADVVRELQRADRAVVRAVVIGSLRIDQPVWVGHRRFGAGQVSNGTIAWRKTTWLRSVHGTAD